MDSTQPHAAGAQGGYMSPKAMVVGLTLLTAGSVIGAWGAGISGMALARSFRRWLSSQQQLPATAIARHKVAPVKAAPVGNTKEAVTTPAAR